MKHEQLSHFIQFQMIETNTTEGEFVNEKTISANKCKKVLHVNQGS